MKKYKIAIDVMGNDSAPEVLVNGAIDALEENEELEVALFGNEEIIRAVLQERGKESSSDKISSLRKSIPYSSTLSRAQPKKQSPAPVASITSSHGTAGEKTFSPL